MLDAPFSLRRSVLCAALATVLLGGCAPKEEEAAPAEEARGERVENADLGVAVAELPAFFRVAGNDGTTIELVPADPQVPGTLVIRESEERKGGINLVAAVERHKASFSERPDGVFKGQRELGSPLGVAFYSRGHFTGEQGPMEETVVFLIHPKGDRELELVYTYPAGEDSKERLNDQLFAVLGEVEAMPVPEAPAEG